MNTSGMIYEISNLLYYRNLTLGYILYIYIYKYKHHKLIINVYCSFLYSVGWYSTRPIHVGYPIFFFFFRATLGKVFGSEAETSFHNPLAKPENFYYAYRCLSLPYALQGFKARAADCSSEIQSPGLPLSLLSPSQLLSYAGPADDLTCSSHTGLSCCCCCYPSPHASGPAV